jgi:hypothetical protein
MAKKELTPIQRDDILLRAACEIDPDIQFEIKNGTMGVTLYAYVRGPVRSKDIRERMPGTFQGLYTVVICTNSS